jgi:hypothetical protein
MIRFLEFLCVISHVSHVVLHPSDGMNYLVADGANSPRKGRARCHGAFRPPVLPPSPPMPPVSLEQLLASLNAIVQKLAAIDELQAG